MLLEFSDWLFYSDWDATRAYAAEEMAEHCTCAYCRNYYRIVDSVYPNLRQFLSRFGAEIEAPESLTPITSELYQASFVVQGKILRKGSEPIWVHDIAITAEENVEPDWFVIQLGIMKLPWVLEQSLDSVPEPYGLADMISDIRK